MRTTSCRSPAQDAPACDASQYDEADCAYITRLVRSIDATSMMAAAGGGGGRPGVPWCNDDRAATCRGAEGSWSRYLVALRVAAVQVWVGMFDRLLAVLAPTYQQRRRVAVGFTQDDLTQMSSEQLLGLMQTALATGEKECSGQIARELSRRRVILQLRPAAY